MTIFLDRMLAGYREHEKKAHGEGYTVSTWREYVELMQDIDLYPDGWEGYTVYHTPSGCPVILLGEPRNGMVRVMYIHADQHYGYGQWHQADYDAPALTDWVGKTMLVAGSPVGDGSNDDVPF